MIMLGVGLILFVFGISHNGLRSVYWDDGAKVDTLTEKTKSLKGIKTIVINTDHYDNVSIKRGNVAQIKISDSNHYPITMTFKKDELTLNGNNNRNRKNGFWGEFSNTDPSIKITIPKNVHLKQVTNNSSANISINDVNINKLNGMDSSGDISLTDVTLNKPLIAAGSYFDVRLNRVKAPGFSFSGSPDIMVRNSIFNEQSSRISTTYGDVTLSDNSLRALNVNCKRGDLEFTNNNIKRSFVAVLFSGDIEGKIAKNQQNIITTSTKNGNISSVYSQDKNKYGNPDHKKIIYCFKTNHGDITVTK